MTLDIDRKLEVALFLFLAVSLRSACALQCYCAEYVDGVKSPLVFPGCPTDTCETSGVCAIDLSIYDKIHTVVKYHCIENVHDRISAIHVICMVPPDSKQIVLCCNESDLCNKNLTATFPLIAESTVSIMNPVPTTTPTTSSSSKEPYTGLIAGIATSLVVTIVAIFVIIMFIILYFLRKRKIKGEQIRRVPTGMKEARPTGEMEFMVDMTVTSGSGSGLPFLIQRTVARTIKITELIGNGRYGQVYLGYYQGEPVAVKKFFSRDENSWCRETEIYNTLLLRHDNILGFFASDMVSNNGVTELWLITQYHQNGSLYDYLTQEAVSPKVMLQMSISTCSGLAHLHTELFGTQAKPAIAHRDMKTKNVLVKNNLTCCIADFGLAVFRNQNEMNIPTNPKQGTKRYMAPEILNETINMKSFESFKQVDVYALGLVLWELCRRCTGRNGVPEDYEVPLQGMVPPDPTFEDMRRVVVVERRQPAIPPRWNTDSEELLREMTKVMRECWYYTSTARPTAVYLKKKLLKMSQELEKMNYGDVDVQQPD